MIFPLNLSKLPCCGEGLKEKSAKMNSCDLNLDLFTEEVLDLIISRYTNYSILKEIPGILFARW